MYSVLIVDDDPMVAMINEQFVLKNKNFKICGSCRNGQEAIDFLKSNSADLVVLDVYMPILNGTDTLKQIRELEIKCDVIMVTAANDTKTLEETMNLGVIDYLIKPFTFERFTLALNKFINKKNSLKEKEFVDQSSVDKIFTQKQNDIIAQKELPKGIQKNTLILIKDYFDKNTGFMSSDSISEKLGLSIVTVRHYLNYLVEQKYIEETVNYETGGRPSMLYKNTDK